MSDAEPKYVIFVYEDGREEKLNWQQFSSWQNDRLNAMLADLMERLANTLDAHAAGQLELMRRDLSDERPTEH